MIQYSGHPYIDIGIAATLAFVDKQNPEDLTEADLEQVARYMTENYTVKPLRSFLTVVFPNSGFTQPAFFSEPDKQKTYSDRVLFSFRSETPITENLDSFFGSPIPAVPYDVYGTLTQGRAFRQHIPLLTGEDVINFFPNGDAGMPISGLALFFIQAFPLACAKVGGKLLAVHSDNPEITLFFAKKFLEQNRMAVHMAQQREDSGKMDEPHQKLRTLIIDTLVTVAKKQEDFRVSEQPFSITAYHLSNSGQGPSLTIYHLPLQVINFLWRMQNADMESDWAKIVHQAWEIAPPPKGKTEAPPDFVPRKNYLFEDLFKLPDNASRFLRTYFLRIPLKIAKMEPGDLRQKYSLQDETDFISWKITQEFLERIMHMDQDQIDQIRIMGERLAEYVRSQNDKRFFQEFFRETRYDYFRNRLLKANLTQVKQGNPPIIEFEPYIQVFEEGTDIARPDWRLARDLVLIRMIECLYRDKNWFASHPEALADELLQTQEEDQTTTEKEK
jgi:CRISPR-associated protein Cst1